MMGVTEAWGGGGSPGDAWWNQPGVASSSGDFWLAFCVRFPHSLVFPDSYLEIRSELVSAFFRCEACGGRRKQRRASAGFLHQQSRHVKRGAVCAAAIAGTPEGLGGSCHSVLLSGRFCGDSPPGG